MDNSLSWFDKRLDAFYRATIYRIDHLQNPLRVGSRSPELDKWLLDHSYDRWIFLTAWNPASQPSSAEQNERAQSDLRHTLLARSFEYYPGVGIDPAGKWPAEPSLFIPGMPLSEGASLAYAFRQNAFLAGSIGQAVTLHWTMAAHSMMHIER